MFILKAEKREKSAKGKQLRRQGLIPAILYGKHLDESVNLQIPVQTAEGFLRTNFIGAQVELQVGKEKFAAMLKDKTYTPGTSKLEHISFQALKADEKIKSVTRVILVDREKVREGFVMQLMNEIPYSAFPADMVDRIEINVGELIAGDVLTIEQLDFAKNENVEILSPLDTPVVTITIPRKLEEVDEAVEDETEVEAVAEQEAVTETEEQA